MQLINIFFLIFIFLSEPFLIEGQGVEWILKADSLENAGQANSAALAWEYAFFKAKGPSEGAEFLIRKAACLRQSGDFERAWKTLERIPLRLVGDSLHYVVGMHLALSYYLDSQWDLALSTLTRLGFEQSDRSKTPDYLLYLALVHNQLGNYSKAAECARELASIPPGRRGYCPHGAEILNVYLPASLPRLKNPQTAEWLSTFMPGLGQAWAGYPGTGLTSFIFNAGALAIGGVMIISGYYLTAYVGGFAVFQKFYFGNLAEARHLAERHNTLTTSAYNDRLRHLLIEGFH